MELETAEKDESASVGETGVDDGEDGACRRFDGPSSSVTFVVVPLEATLPTLAVWLDVSDVAPIFCLCLATLSLVFFSSFTFSLSFSFDLVDSRSVRDDDPSARRLCVFSWLVVRVLVNCACTSMVASRMVPLVCTWNDVPPGLCVRPNRPYLRKILNATARECLWMIE